MERRVAGYLLALIVLAADQGVKYWVLHGLHLQDGHLLVVLPVVNFVLVWNHGITFGHVRRRSAPNCCSPRSPPPSSSRCASGCGGARTG